MSSAISDFRLAYAAGYFDGEGCIWVFNNNKSLSLRASIVSGDTETLQVFVDLFGGKISPVKCKSSKISIFRWSRNEKEAFDFLEKICPFMVCKRYQAQLVLSSGWQFRTYLGGRGHFLPVEERLKRSALQASLREAKRLGEIK